VRLREFICTNEAMDGRVNEMALYYAKHTPLGCPTTDHGIYFIQPYIRRAVRPSVAVVHGLRTVLIRANGRLSYVSGVVWPRTPWVALSVAGCEPCLSTAKANCPQWMMVINDLIPGFYAPSYMQYALDEM